MSNKSDHEAEKSPDYEVGYGRPPAQSRFQPGRSGNPQGRTKGTKNMALALEKELSTRITINEHGRTRTITKRDAIAKQLVNKSAAGDPRLLKLLLGLTHATEITDDGTPLPLSREADEQVKRDLLQRLHDCTSGASDD